MPADYPPLRNAGWQVNHKRVELVGRGFLECLLEATQIIAFWSARCLPTPTA